MFKNSCSFHNYTMNLAIKISCIFLTLLLTVQCSVFSFSVMLKWATVYTPFEWKRNITNDYQIFVSFSFGKKGNSVRMVCEEENDARKMSQMPFRNLVYTRLNYYYCTPWAFMLSEYMHVTILKLPSLIGYDTGFGGRYCCDAFH